MLVHSVVDFNLHIPANSAWFAASAGMAVTNPRSPPPSLPLCQRCRTALSCACTQVRPTTEFFRDHASDTFRCTPVPERNLSPPFPSSRQNALQLNLQTRSVTSHQRVGSLMSCYWSFCILAHCETRYAQQSRFLL